MLRKAKKEDFVEVFELHKSLVNQLVSLNPKRFELKEKAKQNFKKYFMQYLSNKNKYLCVYELNGKVIAYGSARIDKSVSFEKYEKHGWVSEISVSKEYQNKGIGRKVMDSITDFFKKNKIVAVYFLVETNNAQSIKAWEKQGFNKELYMFHKMLD